MGLLLFCKKAIAPYFSLLLEIRGYATVFGSIMKPLFLRFGSCDNNTIITAFAVQHKAFVLCCEICID